MRPEFKVHRLNDDGFMKAQAIAEKFDNLLAELETLCPAGRHFSIVRTHLETACFFAKKAVAEDPANQKE